MVEAKAQYSALVEERAIVVCFLDFHETRESLRKMQKPMTDLRELGQVAQSAYENAFNCKEG